ncbi:unnamed protein product [Brachionus calyciflorus]|uniref:Symplekin n=1 Tax=Brachionus calyciflorus TaxID=104777 RepID=A0A813XNQ5_9BILA|nr:unnamed protein product [Brachionus calyciflorus]
MEIGSDKNQIEDTLEKVAELLNEASISNKDSVRLTNLKHVQELIVYKNPELLDNFLDEILQFQLDKSGEVKKFVVSFIEEACKKDTETIFKLIDNFRYLLFDENVNVQKRAYLAMINIFKNTLKWVVRNQNKLNDEQKQTWYTLLDLKNHIASQLDSDNDGIRTCCIKFLESLILCMSERLKESIIPHVNKGDFSVDQLDQVETDLFNRDELKEEGRYHFKTLLEYTLSSHISSVNLISSICVLSNIAKQRPEFIQTVLETYSKILSNIPPTLGKSQLNAVKKQMKLQIQSICKSSLCVGFVSELTSLLSDLGCSPNEINRLIPKNISIESNKRRLNQAQTNLDSKKVKLNQDQKNQEKLIDSLVERLQSKENVTDLVLVSMTNLPDKMSLKFSQEYKAISNPGSVQQIRSLAQMLVTYIGENNFESTSQNILTVDDDDLDEEEDDDLKFKLKLKSEKIDYSETVGKHPIHRQSSVSTPSKTLPTNLNKSASNKTFKLNDVTNNIINKIDQTQLQDLYNKAHNRILETDENVNRNKHACIIRKKVLVESTTLPGYDQKLTNYVFEDVKKRIDLALIWLYNNYLKIKQCYHKKSTLENMKYKLENGLNIKEEEQMDIVEVGHEVTKMEVIEQNEQYILNQIEFYEAEYDRTLISILDSLQQRKEQKDLLFSKFITQVPYLTDNALNLLKNCCQDSEKFLFNMSTLSELIVTRSKQRNELLQILLQFTSLSNQVLRENACTICLNLYERKQFAQIIEDYAFNRLKYLSLPNPPSELINDLTEETQEMLDASTWNEDMIKSCLYLYLELIPVNHKLINGLSEVYIESVAEIKRVILKMLETPIKKMGMDSQELLKLIQDFPRNSETLVLRIIHILTEKSQPSIDLVNKVRNLYATKLPDVRFLIPILTGLTKAEVIAALPQLIKLSNAVVKEVFNRLLGINTNIPVHKSPVNPTELLVALHQIDQANCDLKTVINATSLCFAEKQIYTQEVLTSVMQQLIEITPIPTLYMRTVIQSLTIYPKLSNFVVIMMQRLIGKQIWKSPKVWEGFIKCCQRIKPLSHQILLKLQPAQLKEVFQVAPDLKEHLNKYVHSITPLERAQITTETMELIENL